MELTVKIKYVFGKKKTYPVCDKSILLAKFKRLKTFTDDDIVILKELGYSFKVQTEEV